MIDIWQDKGARGWATQCGVIAVALLSSGCVFRPVHVFGGAMEPTLRDGERALAIQVFGRLERGDIIGFRYPRDTSKSFVMRIVGLPGEQIEMSNGIIVINGRRIDDDYVDPRNRSSDTWERRTVPAEEFFVMGDNRKNSSDSRTWGTVRRELIWGKVLGH
jgi:signal peptidase I